MDEKLILTDDNNNILNLSLTCPLCAVIDNCDKRGINILHFKLYDVPVTYLNEKHKYHKDTPIGYQYISLIVDPGAQIWNAYPSEIDVVSSYLIVYQNVLYDIKSSILNLPYINTIIGGLKISKEKKEELADEFRDHLESLKSEFIKDGFSEVESIKRAIERFGESNDIKKKLHKSLFSFRNSGNV